MSDLVNSTGRGRATSALGRSGAGSWVPDPIGRNELRWHDGDRLTGWVSNANHLRHDPLASVPTTRRPAGQTRRFADRRHAGRRLVTGVVALACGVAVDVLQVLYASQFTTFYVLFGAPIIWGCTEIFRATRYLLATTQPEAELEPRPSHAPGHSDELAVLDGLLHRGRLNDGAYQLARRKLDRKYNVSVPVERQEARPAR